MGSFLELMGGIMVGGEIPRGTLNDRKRGCVARFTAVMYSSRLSSQKDNGDRRTLEDITIFVALGLVALGFFASGYGVLIGSGGGFIVAPLLIILFGMDHNLAVGTSLFTVALASISGSISYLYLKRVDLRSALLFSMAAIPGSLLGILGLKAVTEGPFEIIFGSFLSLLGLYVMFRPEYKAKPPPSGAVRGIRMPARARAFGSRIRRIKTSDQGTFRYMYNEPGAVATNGLFGFLSSFFGMGGGPVRTPMLVYLFRFPVIIATATSVFTQAIYTSIGTVGHVIYGNVDIVPALLIGVGVVTGAQMGVYVSRFFQGGWILKLLALALLAIGIQLILKGL